MLSNISIIVLRIPVFLQSFENKIYTDSITKVQEEMKLSELVMVAYLGQRQSLEFLFGTSTMKHMCEFGFGCGCGCSVATWKFLKK